MGQHTPGPWQVDLETGEIEAHGCVLGTIYGADDYPCCEDDIDEECKANTHLIAAAPDLLAACEAYLTWLAIPIPDKAANANKMADQRLTVIEQMRAAVSKARGE